MSIINNTRLTEFANGLWAKIKTEVGEGVVNVSFDSSTNILTATKGNDTSIEVDLTSLIGVANIEYDQSTKIITVTKGQGVATQIDLTSLETKWEHLQYTSDLTFTNLIHGLTAKNGHYGDNGSFTNSSDFRSYVIPCKPGKTYRRSNINGFQNTICNMRGGVNGDTFISNKLWVRKTESNRTYWEVTIPQNSNIKYFTISYNHTSNQGDQLMVWDASITPPQNYVENTAKAGVLLGDNVKTKFNPLNSGLASRVVDDAIREIAHKVASGGRVQSVNGQAPNGQGNITLDASHFNDIYSKVEASGVFLQLVDVDNRANKVPRIGGDGKLPASIIPSVAINETFQFTRNTQQEAETAAMSQTVQNGDMIILTVGESEGNRVTKKYLCVDATQNTFANKFIELTFPTDGITEGELNTALQRYVPISDTGIGANQVLRLDAQAKIDDNNLKIATSEEINAIINALQ